MAATPTDDQCHEFTKALQHSATMAPVVLAAFAFAAMPHPAHAGEISKGNEVFTANCVGCHRGGQNFVKEQKTLQKDALEKFVGLEEDKVSAFLKGSFVHKVIGGKLTDDEITDVVSYVVDQAKGEKW
jgi:cytochrome c6